MNLLFAAVVVFTAALFPACSTPPVPGPDIGDPVVATDSSAKKPVLVELFTSEGCSSCPPADNLLIMLDRDQPVDGAEVITLGFHVDYWDHDGWKDRFSSAEFTRRQDEYSKQFATRQIYTPQAVFDGKIEAVGNNDRKVKDAIISSISNAKASIAAELVGDVVKLDITNIPSKKASTVYLAVAENGLASDVGAGENKGERLFHVSVVRDLKAVGKIDAGQTIAKFDAPIPMKAEWKTSNVRYVVLIQETGSMRILGVTSVKPK